MGIHVTLPGVATTFAGSVQPPAKQRGNPTPASKALLYFSGELRRTKSDTPINPPRASRYFWSLAHTYERLTQLLSLEGAYQPNEASARAFIAARRSEIPQELGQAQVSLDNGWNTIDRDKILKLKEERDDLARIYHGQAPKSSLTLSSEDVEALGYARAMRKRLLLKELHRDMSDACFIHNISAVGSHKEARAMDLPWTGGRASEEKLAEIGREIDTLRALLASHPDEQALLDYKRQKLQTERDQVEAGMAKEFQEKWLSPD